MTSTLPCLTNSTSLSKRGNQDQKRLRSACDSCHECKVKCSGGSPCFRCTSKDLCCRYGYQNRAGKPKGSKNRKTLEREHHLRMQWLESQLREETGQPGNLDMDIQDLPLFAARPSDPDFDSWTMDLTSILQTPGETECPSENLAAFTTPISFTEDTSTYPLKPNNSVTTTTNKQPSLPPHTRLEDHCTCVQSQAANISTLHHLTCPDMPDRFDLAMKSITSTLDACRNFVSCEVCDKHFSSLLLTLSAIELILKLFEQLATNNRSNKQGLTLNPEDEERDASLAPWSLGDYEVTNEEGQAIRNVLIKMTLSKGKHTLDELQGLVSKSAAGDLLVEPGSRESIGSAHTESISSVTDRDYMIQCIRRKRAAFEALMAL